MSKIGTQLFRIKSDQTKSYAKVMAMETLRIGLIVFAVFAIIILAMLDNVWVILGVAAGLIPFFGLIGLIIYFARLSGAAKMAKAAVYTVTDYFVALDHDRDKLGGLLKLGAARNEMRTGETIDREIKLSDIDTTVINEKGIVIKSNTYNMLFSPNGRIFIPNEIERFEIFKSIVLNNKTLFKHG